ncbi:MAG TPA: SRPBCC domain-containing protein [Planctomycetota bacterium]
MPDILLDLPIRAPIEQVFEAVSTPRGLNRWWTKTAAGEPVPGTTFQLGFGLRFEWRARVTRCVPRTTFELEVYSADDDWRKTRVAFHLKPRGLDVVWLRFEHTGWPQANEHYRTSCNCWALYLRILRRTLELGEIVPYERRLDA